MGAAAAGLLGATYSGAAAFMTNAEAESGTVAGNATTVDDLAASGSRSVKFGSSSDPLTGLPTRQAGWWWSDQSGVPLGSLGCSSDSGTPSAIEERKQWDYWDFCGSTVVSAAAEGLPTTPWGGDTLVRWHKPLGDNVNVYQKSTLTITKDNWPLMAPGKAANTGSPADVSGRYIMYKYIPSAKFHLNPGHGWVILTSFKENYTDAGGTWHQDPMWGVGCNNFSGPINCALSPHQTPTFALAGYMDRWVKWEMRVYQGTKDTSGHGGRIELYLDDKLMDTGYESQMHVGSAAFVPLDKTHAYVFYSSQYSSNQMTNGVPDSQNTELTSYVGLSTVLPLP